jgi:hypothetical protein
VEGRIVGRRVAFSLDPSFEEVVVSGRFEVPSIIPQSF